MQTNFTRQAAQGPAHRRGRQDPAPLRALRLLHGHLPDLRAARRRARQPARPHLPDEGDVRAAAGEAEPRGAAPRRPLPVVPVVHDDLPERRRLHAPRRPRPRPHRGDRPARLQGAPGRARCWRPSCPIPSASAWRCAAARFARPFAGLLQPARPRGAGGHARAGAARVCCAAADFAGPGTAATKTERRERVILLAGCAQQVLRPEINDATIRLLARRGVDVEVAPGAGCCGALVHHMGREAAAIAFAKRNVDAWTQA